MDNRICVGTWNVGGREPPTQLELGGWLRTNNPADIYVVGYDTLSLFILLLCLSFACVNIFLRVFCPDVMAVGLCSSDKQAWNVSIFLHGHGLNEVL